MQNGDSHHRVNLFFYRVDPFGFGNDGSPGEVAWIRLHCLVTAFGMLDEQISVGENDLRLLGEVIRLFHGSPVLTPLDLDGETIRLQVVFQPLGTDDINHLWSTQGDVAYRTSVAYEMAVVPIIPERRAVGSPLVGALGSEVRGSMRNRGLPFAGSTFVPQPAPVTVETAIESWAPHIAFRYHESVAYSLGFAVGSVDLAAFAARVMILGEPGAPLTLRWDCWSSATGWTTTPDQSPATATDRSLDPAHTETVPTTDVPLPFEDEAGQAVLYAVRDYTRASDGATIRIRRNQLLGTLYEPAA